MLDSFFQELFGPEPGSFGDRFTAGGGPASFDERFEPAMTNPLLPRGLPTGIRPDNVASVGPNPDDATMPQSPPDIMARLMGGDPFETAAARTRQSVMPPGGRQEGAMLPPGATLNEGTAPAGMTAPAPQPNFMERLSGVARDPLNINRAPDSEAARGILGRLMGMNAGAEKRFASNIAGGFAGGNPAFAGGAFMKGAGGAAAGGLKSDKDDLEADNAAADRDQKQSNFDRTQADKEKTTEALRKLYGERGKALEQNAATRAANPGGRSAWNKPAHERFKDAERLILDKEKALRNPLAPKADRAAAEQELAAYRKRVYQTYGIDENGKDLGGGTAPQGMPNATPSPGSGSMRGGGTYQDPHIPTTQEDFDRIPPGGFFINPSDGEILRKKGQKTSSLMDDSEAA